MSINKPKVLYLLICWLGFTVVSVTAVAQDSPSNKVNAPPVVNSNIKKPAGISNEDTKTARQLREAIKQSEIDYTQYMDVLKQHREKAADMKVVRRQSNARVRTTLRSQNTGWNGTYDCDDTQMNVNPGQSEVCDGIDNDCDGDIDEDVTANLFLDMDGDGWGDPRQPYKACHEEAGYASRGQDCNDRNVQVYPGAADVEGDGIDANCDGKDG